jgi:uncharacterized protein
MSASGRAPRDDRAREAESLRELERLYADVDALYAGTSCPSSTECCRFAITGREPYVTSIELALLRRAMAQRGGKRGDRAEPLSASDPRLPVLADERTCPLLSRDGRCSVYAARPFGCRTFFCERAESLAPVRHADMLARVRELKRVAEQHQPGGSAGRPLTRALELGKSR